MDIDKLAKALMVLSRKKIGLQEATTLLLIAQGYNTNKELSKFLDVPMQYIHSRTNILAEKRFSVKSYSAGGVTHSLTPRGAKLVSEVTEV